MSHSLRSRFRLNLLAIAAILLAGYTFSVYTFYYIGLTDSNLGTLLREAEGYVEARAKNPEAPLPASYALESYLNEDTLPAHVLALFPKQKRIPYKFYEKFSAEYGRPSVFGFMLYPIPNSNETLHMFYRMPLGKSLPFGLGIIPKILIVSGLITVFLVLFMAKRMLKQVLNPIMAITKWIENLPNDQPPPRLPDIIKTDEIGQVGHKLRDSLCRIQDSNTREKAFLRNVSHELRTPVAIIKSSAELINKQNNYSSEQAATLNQRIYRASNNMEAVIEAILWLARENREEIPKIHTNLESMVSELVKRYQLIYPDKSFSFDIDKQNNSMEITIEATLLKIAIDNLIRNAFQYSTQDIMIQLDPSRIILHNAFHTYTSEGKQNHDFTTGGFGIGLALVKQIADSTGWQFHFETSDNKAKAELIFNAA